MVEHTGSNMDDEATHRACGLADLIDLEVRFKQDEMLTDEELRARDRKIGLALASNRPLDHTTAIGRRALVLAWLDAVVGEPETPGTRVVASLRLLGYGLVVLGLVMGYGTSRLVLHYDGTNPVNVVNVLGVLIGLQLAFLLALFINFLIQPLASRKKQVSYGPLNELLRALVHIRSKLVKVLPEDGRLRGASRMARSLGYYRHLYGQVERWALIQILQRFAVAFNVAALVTLIYLVAFNDLAFAWSTTLEITPETFKRLIDGLSWPFSWVSQSLHPSLELVEKTKYFRLEGRYVGAADGARAMNVALVGEWWPFLAACLVVYGLLPRLLLAAISGAALGRALRSVRFDTMACLAVSRRMTEPLYHLNAEDKEQAPERELAPLRSLGMIDAQAVSICHVVLWRDAPIAEEDLEALLRRRYEAEQGLLLKAGGKDGELTADEALKTLRASQFSAGTPFVIIVEAWEAPGKAIKRYLKSLRKGINAQTPIYVEILDLAHVTREATSQRQALWKYELAELRDPFMGILQTGEAT